MPFSVDFPEFLVIPGQERRREEPKRDALNEGENRMNLWINLIVATGGRHAAAIANRTLRNRGELAERRHLSFTCRIDRR